MTIFNINQIKKQTNKTKKDIRRVMERAGWGPKDLFVRVYFQVYCDYCRSKFHEGVCDSVRTFSEAREKIVTIFL